MIDILDPLNRHILEEFISPDVLFAFDFDGTLAPIVDDPDDAAMRPGTHALLTKLARGATVGIISGRARHDALLRLSGVRLWNTVGNHGIEHLEPAEDYEQLMAQWDPLLRERLSSQPGVVIENKRFSISVHYRNAPDPSEALRAIQEAAALFSRARVIGGKMVLNILPDGAPDKGIALDCMRRWSGCDVAIYVGDDETDEDAFRLSPNEVLSIRVGSREGSNAPFYVNSQADIDELLQIFLRVHRLRIRRRLRVHRAAAERI